MTGAGTGAGAGIGVGTGTNTWYWYVLMIIVGRALACNLCEICKICAATLLYLVSFGSSFGSSTVQFAVVLGLAVVAVRTNV